MAQEGGAGKPVQRGAITWQAQPAVGGQLVSNFHHLRAIKLRLVVAVELEIVRNSRALRERDGGAPQDRAARARRERVVVIAQQHCTAFLVGKKLVQRGDDRALLDQRLDHVFSAGAVFRHHAEMGKIAFLVAQASNHGRYDLSIAKDDDVAHLKRDRGKLRIAHGMGIAAAEEPPRRAPDDTLVVQPIGEKVLGETGIAQSAPDRINTGRAGGAEGVKALFQQQARMKEASEQPRSFRTQLLDRAGRFWHES